ncbi:TonB-dependent siderophore receptor [Aquabacter spiritensis]|uniref:Iron complex outermembrane receptor protein n=1 Tax=Aquabacter spiritensis TaxID=933073 RepID=A0A4R3LVU4_9HYPH|nr:TonB-dependent siderophore receptor [Aquabacter spiritensis]TCT04694.1 iron complex outermembrane receptor protein [Aquabacter spiritensis]
MDVRRARADRRAHWLGSAAIALVLAAAPPAPARAQSAAPASIAFNIPAQDLGSALTAFADKAGLKLLFPSDLVAGRRSPGLTGAYTPEAAIGRLLQGTGLAYRFTRRDTVTITAPAVGGGADGAIALGTIEVSGAGEDQQIVALATSAGTKTTTPIIDIPQSVSVVTRQEMDQRGVQDFNAAVAYTPGVRVVDYPGGQGMPDVYLRGFRANDQAAFYRDGLRSGFNAYDSDIETYGLQRIDVVKGPASALYGAGVPGGIIDTITKRPTANPFYEIELLGGSFDRLQGAFDIGGPASADGTWLYRLTGLMRDSGTQIDFSPDNRIYFAPAVTYQPTAQTSLTVLASYQKTEKGGSEQSLPMANTLFGTGPSISPSLYLGAPGLTNWTVETTSLGYEFKHAFDSGWTFQQNARYSHSDVDFNSAWGWDATLAVVDGQFINVGIQLRPKTSDSFLIDNRLTGNFDTGPIGHEVLLGVDGGYYNATETRTNSTNYNAISIFAPNYAFAYAFGQPWSDTQSKLLQVGAYAQDQMSLGNWLLTVSGRQDWVRNEEYNFNSRTLLADYGFTDEEAVATNSAFTGRVGLGYKLDNGLVPYASYSTSFLPVAGTDFEGNSFKPTTGEQYEAGIKFEPTAFRGLFTASVFQITQQNVLTNDPINVGYSVQDGEVRVRGVEFEAKANLTAAFDVVASYTYLDAEVTKDNPNEYGTSKVGTVPAGVPNNAASLWGYYTFHDGPLAGLGLGAGVRYIGSSYAVMETESGAQVRVPGYTLVDAALRYDLGAVDTRLKGATLSITGTNLFDTDYYTPGFYWNSVIYGTRRTIYGTLAYRW